MAADYTRNKSKLFNVTVPKEMRAHGMSGHIEALNKWLTKVAGKEIILHMNAGPELQYTAPSCPNCHVRTSRILYIILARLLQNDYIVPAYSELAHFFLCFVCDSPRVLYLHPAVAGARVDASPVACNILPLTQSPAWS